MGGGITRTFRPWTHTSDDSYIFQLSLVVATATVSFLVQQYYRYIIIGIIRAKRVSNCYIPPQKIVRVCVCSTYLGFSVGYVLCTRYVCTTLYDTRYVLCTYYVPDTYDTRYVLCTRYVCTTLAVVLLIVQLYRCLFIR